MRCECCDTGCPVHEGFHCVNLATTTLYRIDTYDETGVQFCEDCADDALESGVFTTRDEG